jgi:hypothetical protein
MYLRAFMYLSDLSFNRKPSVQEGEENSSSSGREEVSVRQRQAAHLFRENFRFGSMPVQPLGSSTVFHAGVIGKYLRGWKGRGSERTTAAGCAPLPGELPVWLHASPATRLIHSLPCWCNRSVYHGGMRSSRVCGRDLAEWLERQTANTVVAQWNLRGGR